jgi:sugar/nucleoside kinase (ribokinase family)
VFGSLNVDTFLKTDRIPKLGETIGAENDKVFKQFGGKGGN